ncbi:MAG TPA: AI-2E family transporter, partial [Micromonosporaceae bacterium]|nr:AI-2E family transporter [Micromonosporaceae bacterium]
VAVLLPFLSPVILAVVFAAILLPVVDRLARHGWPRALSASLLCLAVPAVLVLIVLLVVRGLTGEDERLRETVEEAGRWLNEQYGFDPSGLLDAAQRREVLLGLTTGLVQGAAALFALALSVLIGVYVLFFILKDAPRFADSAAERLPLPGDAVRGMLRFAREGISKYMVGTTAIAVIDTIAITLGAAVLRLPLLGVLALVTFVAAYVPYLGAWVSGALAVIVALGAGGVDAAVWMLVIVLITQNLIEGVARPLAFGVVLKMHPLVVMAVSAIGAAVGGIMGVFLAPPLTAIAIHWTRTIREARLARRQPASPPVLPVDHGAAPAPAPAPAPVDHEVSGDESGMLHR